MAEVPIDKTALKETFKKAALKKTKEENKNLGLNTVIDNKSYDNINNFIEAPKPRAVQPELVQEEVETPNQMSGIDKSIFLYTMGSAAKNENIKNAILAVENGEFIYGLFKESIEQKINALINNTDSRIPQVYDYINSIQQTVGDMSNSVTSVNQLLQYIQQAPVMELLAHFVNKVTAEPAQPQYAQQPPQQPYVQQQQYVQQPQQQPRAPQPFQWQNNQPRGQNRIP